MNRLFSRTLRSSSRKSPPLKRRIAKIRLDGVEQLEDRRLMDGKMQLSFDNFYNVPYIEIRGTLAHDQVRVQRTPVGDLKFSLYSGDTGKTTELVFKPESGFSPGYVFFDGRAGNDYFLNETSIPSVVIGGSGNDILIGGSGPDEIMGMDGHDDVYGRGGIDILSGGRGSDTIDGGADGDHMSDPIGFNKFYAGGGNDYVQGGEGQDVMFGGAGRDGLFGGLGWDVLYGGPEGDYLYGGDDDGWDEMWGEEGYDIFESKSSMYCPDDGYLCYEAHQDYPADYMDPYDWGSPSYRPTMLPPHEIWEAAARASSSGSPMNGFAADYFAGPSPQSAAEGAGPFSLTELWAKANSLEEQYEIEVASLDDNLDWAYMPPLDPQDQRRAGGWASQSMAIARRRA